MEKNYGWKKMADVSAHTPVAVYCIIGGSFFLFKKRRISALFISLPQQREREEKF